MKKSLIIFAFLIVFFNCNEMFSKSWKQLQLDSQQNFNTVCFSWNNDIGFITGTYIDKTTDGGESFNKISIIPNK